jgi:sugar phosphate isomerase/epimerase
MQCLLFTKLFRGLSPDEFGPLATEMGFDGLDVLVRPGHEISPDAPEAMPRIVQRLRGLGLTVPAATTDIADPAASPTERILAACAESDVRMVRLGYWPYPRGGDYRTLFDAARLHLDALERLASQFGVRLMIQLHGGSIHASGALTAALLEGHDPTWLGAYVDPGNQAVQDGRENWALTFDLLAPWLCYVGVKNGGWRFAERSDAGQLRWRADWLGLADGMVPWDDVLAWLVGRCIDVPLSFHSHYEMPLEPALEQTRHDLAYVRRLLARPASGRQ